MRKKRQAKKNIILSPIFIVIVILLILVILAFILYLQKKEVLLVATPALQPILARGGLNIYTQGMYLDIDKQAPTFYLQPSVPYRITFTLLTDSNGNACNSATQQCEFIRDYTLYDDGLHDDGPAGDHVYGNHLLLDSGLPLGEYSLRTRLCPDSSCGFSFGSSGRTLKIVPIIQGQCKDIITRNVVNGLLDNPSNRKLNIIVLGVNILDSRSQQNLPLLLDRINRGLDFDQSNTLNENFALFNVPPTKDYVNKFNVYYIDPMYIGSRRTTDGVSELFFYEYMISRCPTQLGYFVTYDPTVTRADASFPIRMGTSDTRQGILTHEFGHALAGLSDEYTESARCASGGPSTQTLGERIADNIYRASTTTNNLNACKLNAPWSYLAESCFYNNALYYANCPSVTVKTLCYDGGLYCSSGRYLWRPASNTIMRDLNVPLSTVDISAFCRKLDYLLGERRTICNQICMNSCPHGYTCLNTCPAGKTCINNGDGSFCITDPCPDNDSDGICNSIDNCISIGNANQNDLDNDGIGDACDQDADSDGFNTQLSPIDCNNFNRNIFPGAAEICDNGIDEDCSGQDLACPPGCIDLDRDGYGQNCPLGPDCDDNPSDNILNTDDVFFQGCPENPSDCTADTSACAICIHPTTAELCDGIDNNCVNGIDENLVRACSQVFVGQCGIGQQTCTNGVWQGCPLPITESLSNPNPSVCTDNLDNDCDNIIDYCECSIDLAYWSPATINEGQQSTQRFDYSNCKEDGIPQAFQTTVYRSGLNVQLSEGESELLVPIYGGYPSFTPRPDYDCNDVSLACKSARYYFTTNRFLHTETTASDYLTVLWNCDSDGDLFLDQSCSTDPTFSLYSNTQFDCDDANPNIFPGQGCGGVVCTDADNDGFSLEGGSCGAIDCNDANQAINPGAAEICDGIDNNCVNRIIDETNNLCDNGLFCDGAETCGGSAGCRSGTPINCNDGISCTQDICNENTDSCVNSPNNALCNNGLFCDGIETCSSTLGCQAGAQQCTSVGQSCDETSNVCRLCDLTNAYWNSINAVQGQQVSLTVEGQYCNGFSINFAMIEADDISPDEPANVNAASSTFSGNRATSIWTAEWQCDGNIGGVCTFGNPEYFFIASIQGVDTINTENLANGLLTTTALSPTCGNRILETGEQCDQGAGNSNTGTCSTLCTLTTCGDARIQSPNGQGVNEICDRNSRACVSNNYNGNQNCLNNCLGYSTCATTESCGDGVVNGNELCDGGASNGQPNRCNQQCSGITTSICGNNFVELGEQCDRTDNSACGGGQCSTACACQVPPQPAIQILSLPDRTNITLNAGENLANITIMFNAISFTVGGKSSPHLHFQLSNVPAYSFSEEFMFYNSPDNIVEFNLNSGTTQYATWINSNTIRFNNIPTGEHVLKARLMDSSHAFLGNPGAETNITFNIIRLAYCGDLVCNSGESCSSCQQDCGSCPQPPSDSGGGSSGGGGGSYIPPRTTRQQEDEIIDIQPQQPETISNEDIPEELPRLILSNEVSSISITSDTQIILEIPDLDIAYILSLEIQERNAILRFLNEEYSIPENEILRIKLDDNEIYASLTKINDGERVFIASLNENAISREIAQRRNINYIQVAIITLAIIAISFIAILMLKRRRKIR